MLRSTEYRISHDTPTFTIMSHGIRARVPLIRAGLDHSRVLAVLAARVYPSSYVGLVLHCVSQEGLLHYRVDDGPKTRLVLVRPNEKLQSCPLPSADITVEWADIYIRNVADIMLGWPAPYSDRWFPDLTLPHSVFAKVNERGFFAEVDLEPKVTTTHEHRPSVRLFDGTSGCVGMVVLTFRFMSNGDALDNVEREVFHVCLKVGHMPWEEYDGLRVGVRFGGSATDPIEVEPISLRNSDEVSKSFVDTPEKTRFKRCVRLTFGPAPRMHDSAGRPSGGPETTVPGDRQDMLDIDLSGPIYERLARSCHKRDEVGDMGSLSASSFSMVASDVSPPNGENLLGIPAEPSSGSKEGEPTFPLNFNAASGTHLSLYSE